MPTVRIGHLKISPGEEARRGPPSSKHDDDLPSLYRSYPPNLRCPASTDTRAAAATFPLFSLLRLSSCCLQRVEGGSHYNSSTIRQKLHWSGYPHRHSSPEPHPKNPRIRKKASAKTGVRKRRPAEVLEAKRKTSVRRDRSLSHTNPLGACGLPL